MRTSFQNARSTEAALGLRVRFGWATAVLLAGPVDAPRVLDRRLVELSDPAHPETRQPYHSRAGQLEENAAKLERRARLVQRCTSRSVAELLAHHAELGFRARRAGLAVGSLIEPAAIANPHIRAHALEGRLFRTVLEDTLRSGGVRARVFIERRLPAEAAAALG